MGIVTNRENAFREDTLSVRYAQRAIIWTLDEDFLVEVLEHLTDKLIKKNGGADKLKCLPHPPIQLRKDVRIAIRQSQWGS